METREQSSVTTQKPLVQSDLTPHQIAAAQAHERITGPDAPVVADPDTGEKPLTASQLAVVNSQHSGSPTSAATTGGSEDLAAENAVTTPRVGDMVRVHIIENGVAQAKLAYVTSVSNLDNQRLGENGEPYLTVVYQSSTDHNVLGGANWPQGFTRVGPVHHWTSASAMAGRESIDWSDLLPDAAGAINLPSMQLDTAAADKEKSALAQREFHGDAGRGPVRDSLVPAQGATATDAVAQGLMAAPTPENSASVVAERIHPQRSPVNVVPSAPVRGGLAGTAAPATADEQSEQLRQNAIAAGQQRNLPAE